MNCHALALGAIALALASCRLHAIEAPQVVGVHLLSAHEDTGSTAPGSLGWNNVNVGLYARWNNGLTVGAYRNSLFRASAYVGWTLHDHADRFALTLGVVSGYDQLTDGHGDHRAWRCEQTCKPVNLRSVYLPLIVPSVRLPITDRTSARISLLLTAGQSSAVHLSIERRF